MQNEFRMIENVILLIHSSQYIYIKVLRNDIETTII